jgi:hypothetical protein
MFSLPSLVSGRYFASRYFYIITGAGKNISNTKITQDICFL